MKSENKVISFGSLEIPAEDIRYYEMFSICGYDIFNHYDKNLIEWKKKRDYYEEFYKLLKKSGYINDSAESPNIIDELFPMPIQPVDDEIPLHYLYVSTPYDIYEFWEGETDFDIFEKLNELDMLQIK